MIALDGVWRVHRRPEGPVEALRDLSLEIGRGEFVSLTGPSGAGKSSLLHLIGLLDTPSSGRYELEGRDVSKLDDDERTRLRNRRIGFVFQSFHLVAHLPVVDNVELPLAYRGVEAGERRRAAVAALEDVGLGERLAHRPDELSGGEQQRVAIARALAGEPGLLLADEPTGNLDAKSSERILALVDAIHAKGTTIVLVTHDPEVAARAEREVCLEAGRVAGAEA